MSQPSLPCLKAAGTSPSPAYQKNSHLLSVCATGADYLPRMSFHEASNSGVRHPHCLLRLQRPAHSSCPSGQSPLCCLPVQRRRSPAQDELCGGVRHPGQPTALHHPAASASRASCSPAGHAGGPQQQWHLCGWGEGATGPSRGTSQQRLQGVPGQERHALGRAMLHILGRSATPPVYKLMSVICRHCPPCSN